MLLSLFSNKNIFRVISSYRVTEGKAFPFLLSSEDLCREFILLSVGEEKYSGDELRANVFEEF